MDFGSRLNNCESLMGFTLLRITLNKAPRTLPGGRRGGTLSRVRLPQLAQQQAEPRVLAFAVCEPGAERGVLTPTAWGGNFVACRVPRR